MVPGPSVQAYRPVVPSANASRTTSDEILSQSAATLQLLRIPEIAAAQQEGEISVYVTELELLSSHRVCPLSKEESVRILPNISPQELRRNLTDNFTEPATMIAASCIVDALYYPTNLLTGAEKLRSWIKKVRRIGAESAFGVALAGSLGDTADVFVIKSPKDPNDRSLLHELFVGIFGTNQLRNYVPNFVYTFGGFRCSPPVLAGREVLSWCQDTALPVQYVFYENVTNSVSFGDYCRTCSDNEFLAQYLQVLYATRLALRVCGFTHYDCHAGNVLIRKVIQQVFAIPYETEAGNQYLITNRVAVLIDYGISHIEYQSKHFGVWGRQFLGVNPLAPFPLHTAYQLLLSCAWSMRSNGNMGAYRVAETIFRFFNTAESLERALQSQARISFSLLPVAGIVNATLDDLLKHIRSSLATPFLRSTPGNVTVLSCNELDVCRNLDQVLRDVSETNIDTPVGASSPENFTEMYDVVATATATNDIGSLEGAQRSFSPYYQGAKSAELNEINQLWTDLNNKLRSLRIVVLTPPPDTAPGFNLPAVLNPTTMNMYASFMRDLTSLISLNDDLLLRLRMLNTLAPLFSDLEGENFARIRLAELAPLSQQIQQIKQSSLMDSRYLNSIRRLPMVQASYPSLRWYWEGLPTYLPVLLTT